MISIRFAPVLALLTFCAATCAVTCLPAKGFSQTASTARETWFLSNPCLSPDGQTVVFSFEGDLWQADTKGGQAVRLTAMPGYETSPRFSPDGKWIAFTGRQNGNAD